MSEQYHDYLAKLQLTQKLLAELLAEAQTNGLPSAPRGAKRGRPGRVSEEVRAAVVTAYRAGGISQADLAARHGISQTLVCQIVSKGEAARVTAAKIAAGVTPAPRAISAPAPVVPAPRPAPEAPHPRAGGVTAEAALSGSPEFRRLSLLTEDGWRGMDCDEEIDWGTLSGAEAAAVQKRINELGLDEL